MTVTTNTRNSGLRCEYNGLLLIYLVGHYNKIYKNKLTYFFFKNSFELEKKLNYEIALSKVLDN